MRIDRRRSRPLLSSNTQITGDNRIDLTPECLSIVKPIERFSLAARPLLFILGVQRRRSEYCCMWETHSWSAPRHHLMRGGGDANRAMIGTVAKRSMELAVGEQGITDNFFPYH